MLWFAFTILFAVWAVGLIGGIGGNYIHLALVAAVALLVYQLVEERRTVL